MERALEAGETPLMITEFGGVSLLAEGAAELAAQRLPRRPAAGGCEDAVVDRVVGAAGRVVGLVLTDRLSP